MILKQGLLSQNYETTVYGNISSPKHTVLQRSQVLPRMRLGHVGDCRSVHSPTPMHSHYSNDFFAYFILPVQLLDRLLLQGSHVKTTTTTCSDFCIIWIFCHRYRNRWLVIYFLLIFFFNSMMILLPSTGMSMPVLKSTERFDMNVLENAFKMMPLSVRFKWQLYFILCSCSAGMAFTEWALFTLFHKQNGRTMFHSHMERIRNYTWIPLLRAVSRGKFFKFRSLSDQVVEDIVDMT